MKTKIKMASKQLQFVRSVVISQPPSIASSKQAGNISKIENVKCNDLPNQKRLNNPEFQSLGQPPSILAINSPPSVPIYLRKNALLSIYGVDNSSLNSVKTLVEFVNPLVKFFYGGYISRYQKIISTMPFSMLISSSSKSFPWGSNKQKSFATLVLDGTNDWAILNKNSLQTYTGGTLNISMFKYPKLISKKLSEYLKVPTNTETGLPKWNNFGYSLLTGRGQIGLVGNGTVYNITLKENEEILINRNNLLSISVNGPYDLENCIVKYSFPISNNDSIGSENETEIQLNKDNIVEPNKFFQYWDMTKTFSKRAFKFFRRTQGTTYNFLVGNEEFVRVIGPRSLLLQSNSSNLHSTKTNDYPKPNLQNMKAKLEQNSSDFLSYVTIEPGKGAVFKSTPDFKDSVKKIAKKSL